MPTSTYEHIPTLVTFLTKLNPQSILDVGVGNGKMGFIARDLLDVMLGERYRREDWQVRIDGIEIFSDYIQEQHKTFYDQIFIGDAYAVIDSLGEYDLIILGDVLEHFEKKKALGFLEKCASHGSYIILSIPLGENWKQPSLYGNPYEEHQSHWQNEELEPFAIDQQIFPFASIGGDYGCFLIRSEDYIHHRVSQKAEALFSEGKKDEAVNEMTASLAKLTPNIVSEYVLVDLLLRNERTEEAVDRLEKVAKRFPDEPSARHLLEKLREHMGETTQEL